MGRIGSPVLLLEGKGGGEGTPQATRVSLRKPPFGPGTIIPQSGPKGKVVISNGHQLYGYHTAGLEVERATAWLILPRRCYSLVRDPLEWLFDLKSQEKRAIDGHALQNGGQSSVSSGARPAPEQVGKPLPHLF